MAALPSGLLAEYIRPAGYYNVKARRLGNLLSLIRERYGGDVEDFSVNRSLIAGAIVGRQGHRSGDRRFYPPLCRQAPVFVVDTYTHRILSRHHLIDAECGYHEIQELFMDHLEADTQLYNEYHALLVRVGNRYCKKKNPDCDGCPLQGM
jgi:endonuclease III related protein